MNRHEHADQLRECHRRPQKKPRRASKLTTGGGLCSDCLGLDLEGEAVKEILNLENRPVFFSALGLVLEGSSPDVRGSLGGGDALPAADPGSLSEATSRTPTWGLSDARQLRPCFCRTLARSPCITGQRDIGVNARGRVYTVEVVFQLCTRGQFF
jgi:hypothetical protein